MDTQALTSAIRAIDAAAAALGGLVDIGQLDADQIRLLLESVQRCAAEGLVALDEGRAKPATSYTPGPWGDAAIQADANVRLIAAAPELHQALSAIIADTRLGLGLVRPRTMTLVRAAMAKAEGGAA